MATVGDLIENVYDLVLGGRRAATVAVLYTTVNTTATSVVVSSDTDDTFAVGDIVEAADEQLLVTAVSHPTRTLTVIRGWSGTTAAAHTAGDILYVGPVVSQRQVRKAIFDEIKALPPKLWSVTAYDLTTTLNALFYQVTGLPDDATILGTVGVYLGPTTGDQAVIWNTVPFRMVRNLSSTSSGVVGIQLLDYPGSDRTLRVNVATTFTTDDTDSDVVTDDIGLDVSWLDIVEYGAAARIIGRLESVRALSDRASSGTDTGKVGQGTRANTASWFSRQRDRRMSDAHLALRGRYPFMVEA